MFELQKLLWDIRKHPDLVQKFHADPESVLDEYGIDGPERADMKDLNFKALYEKGANPYLLYFCALQLGFDRAKYYAQLRNETV